MPRDTVRWQDREAKGVEQEYRDRSWFCDAGIFPTALILGVVVEQGKIHFQHIGKGHAAGKEEDPFHALIHICVRRNVHAGLDTVVDQCLAHKTTEKRNPADSQGGA